MTGVYCVAGAAATVARVLPNNALTHDEARQVEALRMWWVAAAYLKEPPRGRSDLYISIPDERTASPSLALFSSEHDAAVAARAVLAAMRDQAQRDLELLDQSGLGDRRKWEVEVKRVLDIANRGLAILDATSLAPRKPHTTVTDNAGRRRP
jgi:hypothetical protein